MYIRLFFLSVSLHNCTNTSYVPEKKLRQNNSDIAKDNAVIYIAVK